MRPEQKRALLKWTVHGLWIFLLFLLQQTPGLFPPIFGARPVLLPSAVMCLAMFEGETAGALFGVLAGLMWDATRLRPIGYSSALLMVMGLFCGLLILYFMRNHVFTALFYCGTALLIYELLDLILFVLPGSPEPPGAAAYVVVLVRILYSMLFAPLIYWIQRRLSRRFEPET